MSFESFYGGRMGASFVIVYQFDAITIPTGSPIKYKIKEYAVTSDSNYYLVDSNTELIEKNNLNYLNYNWKKTICNGSTVTAKTDESQSATISVTLSTIPAEGMLECFKAGGDTTDIVNYGEYVIIDDLTKSSPDNGKVFRRGMDLDNGLWGADYIGQICGPMGEVPKLEFKNFNDTSLDKTLIRSTLTQDLIPGQDKTTNPPTYNDDITYHYAYLEDELGDLNGYKIGFQSPYTIVDFNAEATNPYDLNDLITKNIGTDAWDDENNKWTHPYYQKWDVRIPQGKHGQDVSNLELVYTKTKDNINVYDNASFDTVIGTVSQVDVRREQEDVDYTVYSEIIYDAAASIPFCTVDYNGVIGYVYKADCHKPIYRYRTINYDNGDGDNIIINYFYIKTRFIDDAYIETKSSESTYPSTVPNDGTGDQKIHFKVNDGDDVFEDIVGAPLNYIVETTIFKPLQLYPETSVVKYGHLLVYFSDPALRNELKTTVGQDHFIAYPSKLYPGVVWQEWFDLGQTKGDSSGIPILTTVTSVNNLYDGTIGPGHGIPPEELTDSHGDPILGSQAMGWAVSVQADPSLEAYIYFFDYDEREWINSGTLNSRFVDPSYVIAKAEHSEDLSHQVNPGGMWLIENPIICAE